MQQESLTGVVGIRLVYAKNLFAFGMKMPLCYKFGDGPSGEEGRVELQERFGPKGSSIERSPVMSG